MSSISSFNNDLFFPPNRIAGGMNFRIPVNVLDGATEFLVVAEISGVTKDKIELTVETNILTIKVEKLQSPDTMPSSSEFHYLISELSFGTDTRRIGLPLNVDQDSVETCIRDGVLCVKFKKLKNGNDNAPSRIKTIVNSGREKYKPTHYV